jgi:hypothetical protein
LLHQSSRHTAAASASTSTAGLRDRCQIDVERRQILCRPHPRRVPAHLRYEPRRHTNPLRHPLEDRRDAAGMQRVANFISTNQPSKYGSLTDLRMLEPDLELNKGQPGNAPAARRGDSIKVIPEAASWDIQVD